MATEQLPTAVYAIGGQPTVSGWVLPQAQYGIEEDTEAKQNSNGRFNAKITYSRRPTLQVTLEAEHGTTLTAYQDGGQIASGVLADAAGTETAWKIRNATLTKTRGPAQVELDLIAQTDLLA